MTEEWKFYDNYVVTAYREGDSITEIANETGMRPSKILEILNRHHVELRGRGRHDVRSFQRFEVIELYQAGASLTGLAKRYGCSIYIIREILTEENIEIRQAGRPDITCDEVVSLFRDGWSVYAIAKKFNCSDSTIKKRLEKAGLS